MTMTPGTSPLGEQEHTQSLLLEFYTDASEGRDPFIKQRVWRVEAEDDQGSVGIFSFNINNLTFLPPVIRWIHITR